MTRHATCFVYGPVALFLCVTGTAARADECDDMAAKIAKGAGLQVGSRTKANFFPLSPINDDGYGVYLNCGGTYGLNLRFMSPPDPPRDWFQFVGLSGSVLTELPPTVIRDGVQTCLRAVSQSGRDYADFERIGARFFCDVDADDKRVELTITR